ncbi:hypothetical protein F5888DRAFT_1630760 [Russula emetica]|nr:hypothetical protein F5888DRAFT_1630760 [Russula emetica]
MPVYFHPSEITSDRMLRQRNTPSFDHSSFAVREKAFLLLDKGLKPAVGFNLKASTLSLTPLPGAAESLPRMTGPTSLRNQGFTGRMCHSYGFHDIIVGKRETIQRLETASVTAVIASAREVDGLSLLFDVEVHAIAAGSDAITLDPEGNELKSVTRCLRGRGRSQTESNLRKRASTDAAKMNDRSPRRYCTPSRDSQAIKPSPALIWEINLNVETGEDPCLSAGPYLHPVSTRQLTLFVEKGMWRSPISLLVEETIPCLVSLSSHGRTALEVDEAL